MLLRWLVICVGTIVIAQAAPQPQVVQTHYHDDCGCLLICSDRYNPEYATMDNTVGGTNLDLDELRKQRESCHRGCLFYHGAISERDHGRIPAHLERKFSQDKCIAKCSSSLNGKPGEEAACEGGCRDGCLYFPRSVHGRRPSMRLTILVGETLRRQPIGYSPPISQDLSEGIESLLTDPALKQQIEDTQSPTDVKTKIPSSYFTNMPVTHDTRMRPHLCGGGDEEDCDDDEGWLLAEPVLFALMLILFAAFMWLYFYINRNLAIIEASRLPKKMPPPYIPLPSPPYSC